MGVSVTPSGGDGGGGRSLPPTAEEKTSLLQATLCSSPAKTPLTGPNVSYN